MADPSDEIPDEPDRDPDRDKDRDRDTPDGMRQRLEALVPEIVKRTFAAGLGAVFSTEEGIRKIAKDINIPDVAGYLATTADTTKDRVVEIVAREVREFLQTMNFGEEIAKILTALSFEIKTEIRFIPNSEKYTGVEPDVKGSVRIKRAQTERDKPDAPGKPDKTDKPDKTERAANDDDAKKGRRFWRRDEGDEDPEEEDR
jgi:hypothetical protein